MPMPRKMSDDFVRRLREWADFGRSIQHVARRAGVSPQVITRAIRGETYKRLRA